MTDDGNEFDTPAWYEAVYRVVRNVPAGKVVTYGQAADAVEGFAVTARHVGTAMRFAPKDVPWQRVIGAGGRLPIAKRSPELKLLQRRLLQNEGVLFLQDDADRVNLAECQWRSDSVDSPSAQGNLFDAVE